MLPFQMLSNLPDMSLQFSSECVTVQRGEGGGGGGCRGLRYNIHANKITAVCIPYVSSYDMPL